MQRVYKTVYSVCVPCTVPVLVSSRLTSLVRSWVTLALRWSMVSCMAFTRMRMLSFSLCSMEFSWNMSLKPSEPSSPATRFPCREVEENEQEERNYYLIINNRWKTALKSYHWLLLFNLYLWVSTASRREAPCLLIHMGSCLLILQTLTANHKTHPGWLSHPGYHSTVQLPLCLTDLTAIWDLMSPHPLNHYHTLLQTPWSLTLCPYAFSTPAWGRKK